jgi:hypothetical protein
VAFGARLFVTLSYGRAMAPGFDLGSACGICVGQVALGQVFPRVLRFLPVKFIPPVLHYKEERKTNHLHHRVAQYV